MRTKTDTKSWITPLFGQKQGLTVVISSKVELQNSTEAQISVARAPVVDKKPKKSKYDIYTL